MEPPITDYFGFFVFIRAYLRASTKEQDAKRLKSELIRFAEEHGHMIASFYIANESGTTPESQS